LTHSRFALALEPKGMAKLVKSLKTPLKKVKASAAAASKCRIR